jgi:putative transposase
LSDKLAVADDWIAREVAPKATILRIIGINESTYYERQRRLSQRAQEHKPSSGRPLPGYSMNGAGKRISDDEIKEYLLELIADEEHPYGYRKLTICLRRQKGLKINHKKVNRLCKELDILSPQRRVKLHHPRRLARNHAIYGSNELWEIDIKYGYIEGERRFFYLMSIIDVYDRSIVDYYLGLNCLGEDAGNLLQRALWKRQLFGSRRPIIRTDNGPQFVSHAFEKACDTCKVQHERIPS